MDPHLLVGPPGSGKTTRMLAAARECAASGGRVWWVGLPAQRSHVLRLVTRGGPLLGFEFLTPQQLSYRILSDAGRLRPLLTGTGRLALVGEALLEDRDDPPTPGEARLFAGAIAEAKRHGLTAGRIPGGDAETARLRRVFASYERLKADSWDYDDFRLEATSLLERSAAGEATRPGLRPDLVLFDGLREISPPDLRLVRALARDLPVRIALAVTPPGVRPDETLEGRSSAEVRCHSFANPVAEARWVLRDVKARLAAGADPLDLAIVAPRGRSRALAALADEFGVPLMDETPRGLADRPEGRRLLDLLELPEHPTASRLLAVPELHGLGVAALDAGVAGADAVLALARARGEEPLWRAWIERLDPPEDDPMPWAERVVDHALAAVRAEAEEAGASPTDPEADEERLREEARFREHALQRVAEARRVASGRHVRPWWAALLQETTTFARPNAGVALLHPAQASGRRFARAWIVGASDGAYGAGEREDYFVPEDLRAPLDEAFARAGLPRRFLGRSDAEFAELRARGDVTVVTVPEGDHGGRVAPEAGLVGPTPTPAPLLPAGSRLEGPGDDPYRPPDGPVDLGRPEVESLGRYARCSFRFWAEERLRDDDEPPAWVLAKRALRSRRRWSREDLRSLGRDHPAAADWLGRHEGTLASFTFGVDLREEESGSWARLDAARREDGEAVLVRFVAPGSAVDEGDAERILDARSREYWAAAHLFEKHPSRVRRVHLWVWPLDGDPIPFPARGLDRSWARMKRVRRDVETALPGWRAGRVVPTPGWACRDCAVFDVCREGRR